MKAPHIPQEVIEYLEAIYPDKCQSWQDISLDRDAALARASKVELVRGLRATFDRQNKTVLEKT